MKQMKILDCTLRDGGRVLTGDCAFGEHSIRRIAKKLTEAKIDIVEVGFLRNKITYQPGTTLFTDVSQIAPYLPQDRGETQYVAFTDYGMFDYETLPPCDGSSITGIRVGFLRKDLRPALEAMRIVKQQGYALFAQGVNSLSYAEEELIEVIGQVNEMQPVSFGIVDTYGAMYADDVERLFHLVHNHLHPDIAIDFHSHNNYQLSFAHAQQMIRLCEGARRLIVDGTLYGMGKVAGNLNTELLVEYLVRKKNAAYDLDTLLDLIDGEIFPLYQKHHWGYSVPALMSGVNRAHPNNVIYLTSKFRLDTKDIKNILSMMDDDKLKSYDYDLIEKTYMDYVSKKTDDAAAMERLRAQFAGRNVLVLAPGKTFEVYREDILQYIEQHDPIVIAINFEFSELDHTYSFWSSQKRYDLFAKQNPTTQVILSSNIAARENEFVVNYESIVLRTCKHFENSAIMALRLLQKLPIQSLALAGLDGFEENTQNYAQGLAFSRGRPASEFAEINADIRMMLQQYVKSLEGKYPVTFVTPSRFAEEVEALQGGAPYAAIKLLCMDVDGTLTDGGIHIAAQGELEKRFDVKDGYGIVTLAKAGIRPIIITGRASDITQARARELGVSEVYQGVGDKAEKLAELLAADGLDWENVAYIGDDINDLDCLKKAGFSACPNDAVAAVKRSVKYVCRSGGGQGAVREVCEQLLPEVFQA